MTDLGGGVDLDVLSSYSRVDSSDALADVEASAWQWDEARRLALDIDVTLAEHVCVVGMGGSGIAGHLLRALVAARLQVPFVVHQGYGLPAFVGPSTLVLALSHSGNTEETLDAVAQAQGRGASVAAVTSGGRLGRQAADKGWPLVIIPSLTPPRHSLGWLLVPLLSAFGLTDQLDQAVAAQRQVVAECGRSIPRADNGAKQLAARLAQIDLAIAWGTQGLAGAVARRLVAQLNENAKLPAYAAALPEADHNAIVGHSRAQPTPRSALIFVRDPRSEHPRITGRVSPSRDAVSRHFAWTSELCSNGDGPPLARVAELVLRVDLISVYTALARGVDPTPIEAIDELKAVLTGS